MKHQEQIGLVARWQKEEIFDEIYDVNEPESLKILINDMKGKVGYVVPDRYVQDFLAEQEARLQREMKNRVNEAFNEGVAWQAEKQGK